MQRNEDQEESKEGEVRESPQFEKRAKEFVSKILNYKANYLQKPGSAMIIQILEIISNKIETDLKNRQLKCTNNPLNNDNNSQKQIDIMFYIENAISSYALIKQKNRDKTKK